MKSPQLLSRLTHAFLISGVLTALFFASAANAGVVITNGGPSTQTLAPANGEIQYVHVNPQATHPDVLATLQTFARSVQDPAAALKAGEELARMPDKDIVMGVFNPKLGINKEVIRASDFIHATPAKVDAAIRSVISHKWEQEQLQNCDY